MNPPVVPAHKSLQAALTVLGLAGIAMSFVPFVLGVVPFTEVLLEPVDGLWIRTAPCILLPVLITPAYAAWLVKDRIPARVSTAALLLAGLFATGVLVRAAIYPESGDPMDIYYASALFLAFAGAAWLSLRGIRHDMQIRGLVAMQCVFIVSITFFVIAAFVEGIQQIGAWLALVTILVYFAQISLAVKRQVWMLALIVPISCLAFIICYFG